MTITTATLAKLCTYVETEALIHKHQRAVCNRFYKKMLSSVSWLLT